MSVSLCGLAQTERIVILHTNDTHSQMEPFAATHKTYGGLGGVMRRMAIIDSIRNAEPNVLLVAARCRYLWVGDVFFVLCRVS